MEVEAQLNLLLKALSDDEKTQLDQLLATRVPGRLWERGGGDSRMERIERACYQQLMRLHDVVAQEKPRLRLRHAGSIGTFLEAAYQQGELWVHYAVMLAPREVEPDWLRSVHQALEERDLLSGSVRPSQLLFRGPRPPEPVRQLAKELGLWLLSLEDFENLIDFRAHVAAQTQKLTQSPGYSPSLYVPQRMQVSEGASFQFERTTDQALETVLAWLQDPGRPRFILLLGDFGVGKTFLLRELCRNLGASGASPWPLFLELRQLEKANDLRPLLASYLAKPEFSETLRVAHVDALLAMMALGRVVLFFDGFDELALRISYQRATQHLDTLLQSVASPSTLAKVVVTSRTQHFLSMSDLEKGVERARRTVLADRLTAVAVSIGRLLPFEESQIQAFLHKQLGQEDAAAARMALIRDIKDLLGLSRNPRMLSFIAELPEADLRQAQEQSGEITAAKLYDLLVTRWLHFELKRADDQVPEPGLDFEHRLAAATAIALRLWGQADRGVPLDALGEAVRGFLHDHECAQHQLGSGTLLVRDDAGRFSFLHESVLEWLVARAAAVEVGSDKYTVLGRHELSPLMAEFFWGLAGREPAARWAERVLLAFDDELGERADVLKRSALTVLKRLGRNPPERQNLAGKDLRGRDFTGQSLAGAILDGAQLDDATLTGVSLRQARLRGASLRRAKLDRCSLREADLGDANLSGASLLGADLRGARLSEQTKLRRARLVRAILDEGMLDRLPMEALWGAGLDREGPVPCVISGDVTLAIAWHPTELLCAFGKRQTIEIWDCELGIVVRVLRGHEGSVNSVSFSPGGCSLASASGDDTVRLWEVGSGRELGVLRGHDHSVTNVSFSPDGLSLASASRDKTVRLWEVGSGRELGVLRGHDRSVTSVSFSPDGRSLASASRDNTVRLWKVGSGRELGVLLGHESSVNSVSFSPDGHSLASASGDKTVRLWDVGSGRGLGVLRGHESSVNSVSFGPDGRSLASASGDKTVRLWEVGSGRELGVLRGHDRSVTSVSFSPDGRSLASASWDSTVRLWEIGSGRELGVLRGHEGSVTSASFSPDGLSLASASRDTIVRLWEVGSGRELGVLRGHEGSVTSVSFSPDGHSLASASWDNMVRLWEVGSGRELGVLRGHEGSVTSVSFSPDGRSLASASWDKTVRLWEVGSGRELGVLRGHKDSVTSASFSPDGRSLASASGDKTVRLWEVDSGRELGVLRGHKDSVTSVSFSPDGRSLASASRDETVRLWEVGSGRELGVLRDHEGAVNSVSFSPDGRLLASASWDNTLRLWEAGSGRELGVLRGHVDNVNSVSFSPDGRKIISASNDGTIKHWSISTCRCIATLISCGDGYVVLLPDGRYKRCGELPNPSPFFYSIELCRFEPGELDEYIPDLRLALEQPLSDLPAWEQEVVHLDRPVDPAPPVRSNDAKNASAQEMMLPPPHPPEAAQAKIRAVPLSEPAVRPASSAVIAVPSIASRVAPPSLSAAAALIVYWLLARAPELPLAAFIALLGAFAGSALSRRR